MRLTSPTASQRPVHPEDSTHQGQEQGKLQEDQEQEVDTAEQGPMGEIGTGNDWLLRGWPRTLLSQPVPVP